MYVLSSGCLGYRLAISTITISLPFCLIGCGSIANTLNITKGNFVNVEKFDNSPKEFDMTLEYRRDYKHVVARGDFDAIARQSREANANMTVELMFQNYKMGTFPVVDGTTKHYDAILGNINGTNLKELVWTMEVNNSAEIMFVVDLKVRMTAEQTRALEKLYFANKMVRSKMPKVRIEQMLLCVNVADPYPTKLLSGDAGALSMHCKAVGPQKRKVGTSELEDDSSSGQHTVRRIRMAGKKQLTQVALNHKGEMTPFVDH